MKLITIFFVTYSQLSFAGFLFRKAEDDSDEIGQEVNPEESPGLYQGDIAIDVEVVPTLKGFSSSTFQSRKWPNGIVPYEISIQYDVEDRIEIIKVLRKLNILSCVHFVPRSISQEDYIFISPNSNPKGCWSYIGKRGGAQTVSLQAPDSKGANCLGKEGRIIHELMHALGFIHEQSRPDRDDFVTIHWENIVPKYKKNFKKVSIANSPKGFMYDYNSVMHYGKSYFSKTKGLATLTPKISTVKIGQREMLSKTDCLKLNYHYGCLNGTDGQKYYNFCQVLGV